MAAEDSEVTKRQVLVRVTPFDAPDATEHYANMTGAGITPNELVIVFARFLPQEHPLESSEIKIEPRLRVIMPVSTAQNLLNQLRDQLEKHRQLVAETRQEESGDVGPSDA